MAEVAKSPEGWVDITVIAKFNKVKGLVPDEDATVIADALRYSNFLEVSADSTTVRRPGLVKKAVTLGGSEFTTRDEVISHARELIALGDTAEGGALPEGAHAFIDSLLELHDKKAEKRGEGEYTFKVGRNPDHPDTACFVIKRADGAEVRVPALVRCRQPLPLPSPLLR